MSTSTLADPCEVDSPATATIRIRGRSGREHTLPATPGRTLMDLIRDGGVDEILALCGGSCSCATCHVQVDATFIGRLPPPSDDEEALLDGSEHRTVHSRLACQVVYSDALAGLRVTIAPED